MKVEKRLLKYIAIKTPCDENSDTVPTSQCQFDLARILADELKELGLDKVAFTSGIGEKNFMDQFIGGAADLMGVALVVGVARGINIILEDGMISDTILEFFSGAISGMNPIVFIILMMLVFIVLGFFISSSSGLAVLSIPIMAPLADTVGVSRSAIVSAYAYGLGLISFITPTGLILASLAMVDVTYDKWLKFIMPLMGMTTVFSAIMLIIQLYV